MQHFKLHVTKDDSENLVPEAQTAGKKIHEIFAAKKGDRKAAHEEVNSTNCLIFISLTYSKT